MLLALCIGSSVLLCRSTRESEAHLQEAAAALEADSFPAAASHAQQGVKAIEAVGKPFDTEEFEAIATIPAPQPDLKGKVIDCVQTGYVLYDKVLRHARVVVGE